MDNHSSTTIGFLWLSPDLLCAWAPFNPPANNQIKEKKKTCWRQSRTPTPNQCFLAFLFHPSDDVCWRLEAAEMDLRTEKRCCHRYNPFILLYDWRLCECVKTHRLGMPGRRWRAQVSLSRMHQKHLHRGQKTHSVYAEKETDSWNIKFKVNQWKPTSHHMIREINFSNHLVFTFHVKILPKSSKISTDVNQNSGLRHFMQSRHISERLQSVGFGNTHAVPAAVCECIHTFTKSYSFHLKAWARNWLHFHPNKFLNGKFLLSVVGSWPSVIAQPGRSRRLSAFTHRPFASAYLVPFVPVGTSSSPTRLQQLSWEWKGAPRNARPADSLGHSVNMCLSQGRCTNTHSVPLIWLQIRGTLSNVTLFTA